MNTFKDEIFHFDLYFQGPILSYSLYATIQHEGYSCNSGHYVANVRCGTKWIHFNDSLVNIAVFSTRTPNICRFI